MQERAFLYCASFKGSERLLLIKHLAVRLERVKVGAAGLDVWRLFRPSVLPQNRAPGGVATVRLASWTCPRPWKSDIVVWFVTREADARQSRDGRLLVVLSGRRNIRTRMDRRLVA